jgi:hypothetical protein
MVLTPEAFTHPAYYAMAVGGMLFSNYGNLRTARKVYGAPSSAQLPATAGGGGGGGAKAHAA